MQYFLPLFPGSQGFILSISDWLSIDLINPDNKTMDNSTPGPSPSGSFSSICLFCSAGCSLQLSYHNNQINEVNKHQGLINPEGFICDRPGSGYRVLNSPGRLTTPLLKKEGVFRPVSWETAFGLLIEKLSSGQPGDKAFFAGARLTNEEHYLIQKLARAGVKTNNIGSFHYLGRGTSYTRLSRANLPFAELAETTNAYVFGSSVLQSNPLPANYLIENRKSNKLKISLITNDPAAITKISSDQALIIKSYYHFVRALNYYLVTNNLENKEFIRDLIGNYAAYRESLLQEDPESLFKQAGIENPEIAAEFILEYLHNKKSVLVFCESELSGHACAELFNLACLSGKHGKDGSGLMLLKESCNSHGLHDMGVFSNLGPGATDWQDPFMRSTFEFNWGVEGIPSERGNTFHKLQEGAYRQFFIFGEDPVGCAINKETAANLISGKEFVMVQDFFLTETAALADLVLPSTLAPETGGTVTNCQRVIQKISHKIQSPVEVPSWKQIDRMLNGLGFPLFDSADDVTMEMVSLLPKFCTSSKLSLRITGSDNYNPLFRHGCNCLEKMASEELKGD